MSWGWRRLPSDRNVRLTTPELLNGPGAGMFMVSIDGMTPQLARLSLIGEVVAISTDLQVAEGNLVWCPIDWPDKYEETPA